jgi:hypothetical protein
MEEFEIVAEPVHYIRCCACGDEHLAGEIRIDGYEEDIQGRDVLTYRCPTTAIVTKAFPLLGYR